MIGEEIAAFDGRFLGIDLSWTSGNDFWLGPGEREPVEAAPRDAPDRVESMLRRTSVAHELRHFHDFLLSPVGSVVARARFLATVNTLQLLSLLPLHQASEVTLPVPIGRWLAMPEATRQEYLQRATSLFERTGSPLAPPVDLPFVSKLRISDHEQKGESLEELSGSRDEVLAQAIDGIVGQFSRVDYFFGGVETDSGAMYPSFPFEASGIVAQLQHIGHCFGPGAIAEARDLLASQPNYAEVLASLFLAGGPVGGNWAIPLPDASTLYVYALLGSCEPSSYYAQPLVRQSLVMQHLFRNGPEKETDIPTLFEKWDQVLDDADCLTEPTLTGLEASLAADVKLRTSFLPKLLKAHTSPELATHLTTTFGEFLDARRDLVEDFLEDPQGYLYPGAYLKSLPRRPRPPARITVGKGLARACQARIGHMGWSPAMSVTDREVICYPPQAFLPGKDAFALESLDVSTNSQAFAEMLFTDAPRASEIGLAVMRILFGKDARILRVVGSGSPVQLPRSLREGDQLYSRYASEP